MSPEEIDQEEMGVFLDEMEELQQILEEDILKLEKEADNPSLIAEIFRAAHTIKGSGAAMGFTNLSELAHSMETVFDGVRSGTIGVSASLIDVFLQCSDTLKAMRDEIAQSGKDETKIKGHLNSLAGLLGSKGKEEKAKAERKVETIKKAAPPPPKPAEPVKAALENFFIKTDVEKGCQMPFVRAFQVLTFLSEIGEVVESSPSEKEIEDEEMAFPLELVLSTYAGMERTREVLEMVSDVIILDFEKGDSLRGGAVVEEKAPPPPVATEPAGEPEEAMETQPPVPEPAVEEPEPARAVEFESEDEPEPAREKKGAEKDEGGGAGKRSVRVNVERVDAIMDLIGELVINRTRLTQLSRGLELFLEEETAEPVNETADNIELITSQLQEHIMKARLLPIESVFSKFPRMVRSLSKKYGKQIELVIKGEKTELDRSVLEQIGDPLMHIIRNSVDHGIETVEEREKAGKPRAGKIHMSASHVEDHIIIRVEDDGNGIDPKKVLKRAQTMNVAPAEVLARLKESEILKFVFAPGFSTKETVSEVSGRGVGMDVVKTNIQKLSGSVTLRSEPGKGTTMTIKLPLTLAIIKSLLVTFGSRIFAIPLVSVVQTLRLEEEDLQAVKGKETILFRGGVLPLLRLEDVFSIKLGAGERKEKKIFIVIVSWGGRPVGIVVDSLIGDQDIVIRPLGEYVGEVPGISGATILGDGSIALIIDVEGLVKWKLDEFESAARSAGPN